MADAPDIALLTPYARSLGIALDRWEDNAPVLHVDFSEAVLGRPGALHGGAISGLLETAGYGALRAALAETGREASFVPINITVQFLRGAGERTTYAVGRVTRAGGRTANVDVEAWQADRKKPVVVNKA